MMKRFPSNDHWGNDQKDGGGVAKKKTVDPSSFYWQMKASYT